MLDVSCILCPDGFFRAIDNNTYDVDCDHTGFFSNSPTGYGRTPLDAIVDLLEEIDAQGDNTSAAAYTYQGFQR